MQGPARSRKRRYKQAADGEQSSSPFHERVKKGTIGKLTTTIWSTTYQKGVYLVHGAVSVGGGGVEGVVEVDLTATHFSFSFFPPSSTTAAGSSDFSVSSSEVTLSSVSASTPVVVSDSELEDDDEVTSEAVASVTGVAAGVDSVDAVEVATEESLFAAVSARSFLAFAARSFLSSFWTIFFCLAKPKKSKWLKKGRNIPLSPPFLPSD
ncbi:hypothetical protein BYT27DRAFT_6699639 [Phlegmacium glaucopus]|nr:hypothetical protein BYT27DRAFT_6699639 [Phlegmacium glaucopus]